MIIRTLLGISLTLSAAAAAQAQGDTMGAYHKANLAAPKPALVERYGPDDMRLGHLRLPAGKGPHPVAVIIHGGCWTTGFDTVTGLSALSVALNQRGIATWSIEYRMGGQAGAGWPGTFEDVDNGVDHLAKLAKRYPIDLSRVSFVGHSAGAHLALWAASRGKLDAKFAPTVKPVSAVALDGPAALTQFIGFDAQVCGKPVIEPFMGVSAKDDPAAYKAASPAEHFPLGVRQLIAEAAFKPFMAPLTAAASSAGDPVEVLRLSDDHFELVTPGTADGDKVVEFIATRAFAK